MEKEIIELIEEKGPMTGQELLEATSMSGIVLWRSCKGSSRIVVRNVGTRYLRLDSRIEGYARLSPSILREFLTYSVVGLPGDPAALARKGAALISRIEEISRSKLDLAYNIVSSLASRFRDETDIKERACFILAGDIVYNMAHDVPRPERSTGRMVRGSDMDIVVIVDDLFPDSMAKRLDEAIYREKTRLLMTPHLREEIDYVVKDLDRVREQLRFDTFKRMVACKILSEGLFLYGSEALFREVKALLREYGVEEMLRNMERRSMAFRRKAEEILLREDLERIEEEFLYLFYPAEESEEFE
ncbi:MAG: hypothetical protein JRH13_05360 [Deltaproteobacteria bacterium]|nr:hypothetical protein [Deltaproteobacteria bacterium]MBW2017644.1 hypothetical protein [Deltaproteobacteria bacterium]MBW2128773.1 hypothetical protein [Deltaproteobacteria bacterium]MBW2303802.1 hypothetical protein [Deltaproteobacteria bacterium]